MSGYDDFRREKPMYTQAAREAIRRRRRLGETHETVSRDSVVWKTRGNRVLSMDEIDDDHLRNIIRFLEGNGRSKPRNLNERLVRLLHLFRTERQVRPLLYKYPYSPLRRIAMRRIWRIWCGDRVWQRWCKPA